jgi:hypothetical protein
LESDGEKDGPLWCGGMGMSKERDGVFLAFGVAGLPFFGSPRDEQNRYDFIDFF